MVGKCNMSFILLCLIMDLFTLWFIKSFIVCISSDFSSNCPVEAFSHYMICLFNV